MISLEQILSPIKKLQGMRAIFVYYDNSLQYFHATLQLPENIQSSVECITHCYDIADNSYKVNALTLEYDKKSIIVKPFESGCLIVVVENYFNSKMFFLASEPILKKIQTRNFTHSPSSNVVKEILTADTLTRKTIGGCLIGHLIGQGGSGKVYKGIHLNMGMKVAVKILSPNYNEEEAFIKCFVQEGKILAQIEHPNIAKIINLGEEQGYHFLIMRYIEGEDLDSMLTHEPFIPYKILLSIGIDICSGLRAVHKLNVVHRDIKPSNIIIEQSTGIPILVDFGSVHKIDPDKRDTIQGSIIGTPLYMSPEQCMGKSVNQASDIYSLGATLYHLATGVPPFETPTSMSTLIAHIKKDVIPAHEKKPSLPVAFSNIICKMMNKKPNNRYQNIEEVMKVLQNLKKQTTTTLHKVVTRMTKDATATQKTKLKKYFDEKFSDQNEPPKKN